MAANQEVSINQTTPTSRCAHVAISKGRLLLVWGGHSDAYVGEHYVEPKTIQIYHSDHKYWSEHETTGDIPGGTSGASSYLVAGKLYVFAGHTDEGNVNDLFCLDLNTLKWKKLSTVEEEQNRPSPRDKFASWCTDTKLYCFGGYGVCNKTYLNESGIFVPDLTSRWPQRGWNNQLFEYDIETNVWTNVHCKGTSPAPRAAHAAARFGSYVYIFGGRHGDTRLNDLHCLHLDSYSWGGEILGDTSWPCGRSWHTLTPVTDSIAFMYGGYSNDGSPLDDAWLLNVVTKQWSKMTVPGVETRLWHTCCKVDDNTMLVYGGCTNDILDYTQQTDYSNEILEFHIQPISLKLLCLQSVYQYHKSTEKEWIYLPKPLSDWLKTHKEIESTKSTKKTAPLCLVS